MAVNNVVELQQKTGDGYKLIRNMPGVFEHDTTLNGMWAVCYVNAQGQHSEHSL
jgi:hypothetical protein